MKKMSATSVATEARYGEFATSMLKSVGFGAVYCVINRLRVMDDQEETR